MYQGRPLGWDGAQCVPGPISEHLTPASQLGQNIYLFKVSRLSFHVVLGQLHNFEIPAAI